MKVLGAQQSPGEAAGKQVVINELSQNAAWGVFLAQNDLDTSPGGGGASVQICPPGSVPACWKCDHLRRAAVAEVSLATGIQRCRWKTPHRLQPVAHVCVCF